MEQVPLGATRVCVSRLVMGCAPLGGLFAPVAEQQARATVDAAWDLGVRTFDTAPHYGAGLSERRLGAALRRNYKRRAVSLEDAEAALRRNGHGDPEAALRRHGSGDADRAP